MSKIELTDHPYLYLSSLAEAKRNNELDRWRESHQHNMACKAAIEAAIRKDFDGMHLNADCAHNIIAECGFKRMGWVLANTIQRKNHDGRFSIKNKEWAESNYIPHCSRNSECVVESHPAVLDGFVDQFRKALAELQLFGRSQCESMMGRELEKRILVLSPVALKESCWSPQNQLWLAGGGFGCRPSASGRAVYATCLGDGENTRWNRSDFIGILREEHLPEWAKESLEVLQK